MLKSAAVRAALVVLTVLAASPAMGQLPPGVFPGERSYEGAASGLYAVDPDHTAVIAKVSHIGYSLSVFRFDKVEGSLSWDPAAPERSKLTVSVATASISTPVAGFAKELTGPGYLKSADFPTASFVSTAFHRTDPTRGQVDGVFTLLGKSRPVTFQVEFLGGGKGFMGHPRLGVEATAEITPSDYGLSPLFSTPIRLVIDAEFART